MAVYVCRNSVIRRLSIAILGVLRELVARYIFFVLFEKPATKDRKTEFLNKSLAKNRPSDTSPKNTK